MPDYSSGAKKLISKIMTFLGYIATVLALFGVTLPVLITLFYTKLKGDWLTGEVVVTVPMALVWALRGFSFLAGVLLAWLIHKLIEQRAEGKLRAVAAGYSWDKHKCDYHVIDAKNGIYEHMISGVIRAQKNGVRIIEIRQYWTGKSRSVQTCEFTPISGIEKVFDPIIDYDGFQLIYMVLNKELPKGSTLKIEYKQKLIDECGCAGPFYCKRIKERMSNLEIAVHFHEGQYPMDSNIEVSTYYGSHGALRNKRICTEKEYEINHLGEETVVKLKPILKPNLQKTYSINWSK